jgi:hypothetical protein
VEREDELNCITPQRSTIAMSKRAAGQSMNEIEQLKAVALANDGVAQHT